MLDRFIQPAWLQGRPAEWDQTVSDCSDGCRPGRAAHQAVARAQGALGEGEGWGVALELEKVCDRGHHDKLLSLVKARVADRRVLQRIDRDLTAGALTGKAVEATAEGTPPGGPRLAPAVTPGAGRFGPGVGASGASVRAFRG